MGYPSTENHRVHVLHLFLLHRWATLVLLTSGGAAAAKALEQQFTYVYTPARQAKDLARIPSLVADK